MAEGDRPGERRRGRGAPAPTRAPVRARDPRVAVLPAFLRDPGPAASSGTRSDTSRTSSARSRRTSSSFDRYVESFSATFRDVFSGTLRISIVGTILCLLIGFPFAYWLAVKVPPRWRGLLLGLTIVPFWTNFLVRTLGLADPAAAERPALRDPAGPPSDRRSAGRPRHPRGRPARRGLQLPPADDLPAVRRARPPRPGAP